VKEISAWAAHVICLQEVDHFEDFFEPELKRVRL
jgi:mRNA deadenylase 3'-5' endonuclease subunit Ccr4